MTDTLSELVASLSEPQRKKFMALRDVGDAVIYDRRSIISGSLWNPTMQALERRGLAYYRGFDGNTPGGWFVTEKGAGPLDGVSRETLVPTHGGQ